MNQLIKLAQKTLERYIKEGEKISPPSDIKNRYLKEKAGVFVTIKKGEDLKGCIGTYKPTQDNIAKEVIENTIAAGTQDSRFSNIKEKELSDLSYEIYILGEPELVQNLQKLDPDKYGVLVKNAPSNSKNPSTKTGLLLPDLEGVDTKENIV